MLLLASRIYWTLIERSFRDLNRCRRIFVGILFNKKSIELKFCSARNRKRL